MPGALLGLQLKVMSFLEMFNEFDFLWSESLTDKRSAFLSSRPSLDEMEEQITALEQVSVEITKFIMFITIE